MNLINSNNLYPFPRVGDYNSQQESGTMIEDT